jgi:hypothetical protein
MNNKASRRMRLEVLRQMTYVWISCRHEGIAAHGPLIICRLLFVTNCSVKDAYSAQIL